MGATFSSERVTDTGGPARCRLSQLRAMSSRVERVGDRWRAWDIVPRLDGTHRESLWREAEVAKDPMLVEVTT
jgi:hypothetical protein